MYPAPTAYLQLLSSPQSNRTSEEAGVQLLALQRVRDLSTATGRQKGRELGYKGKNSDTWWVTKQRHECLLTQMCEVFKEGKKKVKINSGTGWIVESYHLENHMLPCLNN